jgi:hypothetical protein
MSFRITGLSPEPFKHLYGLSEEELARHGVKRYVAAEGSGFPDRIEMRDARPGETVLLLNHVSQPAASPYHARHAIFVRDEIPAAMRKRVLSLRAFDAAGMIVDADIADGLEAESVILRFLANPDVAYIHAHNAKYGCYSGRIDRA